MAQVGDTVRSWLDTAGSQLEAFATQGSGLLSGLASRFDSQGAQFDSTGNKLDDVNAKLDSHGAKLDRMNAQFDSGGAKLDDVTRTVTNTQTVAELIDSKMDASAQQCRRDKLQIVGAIFVMGLFLGLLICVLHTAPIAPAPAQSVTVNVQGVSEMTARTLPGGLPVSFDLRAFLGAFVSPEMGKKAPEEQLIPDKPLPGQKLPPCEPRLGEAELKGGCWGDMTHSVKPPCGLLFRHGDGCYRPIAADLSKGVGLASQVPGQGQHQTQP